MHNKIFVVSGLGADHTVFQNLELPKYELVHIEWVDPNPKDSMADYAKELLPQITEENPILLGLSLGGMLVVEIAKLIPTQHVISLSSVISYAELPKQYKLARFFKLQKWIPVFWLANGNYFTYQLFGVKTPENKAILDAIFTRLDRNFLYWALNAVLTWKNQETPKSFTRIHGTADMVLPIGEFHNYDAVIQDGSHLMLLNKPQDVSRAILNRLEEVDEQLVDESQIKLKS